MCKGLRSGSYRTGILEIVFDREENYSMLRLKVNYWQLRLTFGRGSGVWPERPSGAFGCEPCHYAPDRDIIEDLPTGLQPITECSCLIAISEQEVPRNFSKDVGVLFWFCRIELDCEHL